MKEFMIKHKRLKNNFLQQTIEKDESEYEKVFI